MESEINVKNILTRVSAKEYKPSRKILIAQKIEELEKEKFFGTLTISFERGVPVTMKEMKTTKL